MATLLSAAKDGLCAVATMILRRDGRTSERCLRKGGTGLLPRDDLHVTGTRLLAARQDDVQRPGASPATRISFSVSPRTIETWSVALK